MCEASDVLLHALGVAGNPEEGDVPPAERGDKIVHYVLVAVGNRLKRYVKQVRDKSKEIRQVGDGWDLCLDWDDGMVNPPPFESPDVERIDEEDLIQSQVGNEFDTPAEPMAGRKIPKLLAAGVKRREIAGALGMPKSTFNRKWKKVQRRVEKESRRISEESEPEPQIQVTMLSDRKFLVLSAWGTSSTTRCIGGPARRPG